MQPDTQPSGFAGTVRVRVVTVPAFCWLHRSSQIRDFLLLYLDIARDEQNTWAQAHLDSLIRSVDVLEQRAETASKLERPSV